jgi:hypothetical protein
LRIRSSHPERNRTVRVQAALPHEYDQREEPAPFTVETFVIRPEPAPAIG